MQEREESGILVVGRFLDFSWNAAAHTCIIVEFKGESESTRRSLHQDWDWDQLRPIETDWESTVTKSDEASRVEGGEHEVVGEGEEEGEEDAGEGQSQRRAQKPQQNLRKPQQNFKAWKSKKVHKKLNKNAPLVLKSLTS